MRHWLHKYNLLIYNEIDSTNSEVHRLIESGVEGQFLVFAHRQKEGYGRSGRNWFSPEGNLYLSIILNPKCSLEKGAELSFVSAIALHKALTGVIPAECKIELKWPNDVLINGKKVAGILLESHSNANVNNTYKIIIGLGLNIEKFPKNNIQFPATSLKELKANNLIPEYYLDQFMKNFDYFYNKWKKDGFSVIREQWLKFAYNKNKVVTVVTNKERISGFFEDLDDKGRLVIRLSNGDRHYVSGGNVFFDNCHG